MLCLLVVIGLIAVVNGIDDRHDEALAFLFERFDLDVNEKLDEVEMEELFDTFFDNLHELEHEHDHGHEEKEEEGHYHDHDHDGHDEELVYEEEPNHWIDEFDTDVDEMLNITEFNSFFPVFMKGLEEVTCEVPEEEEEDERGATDFVWGVSIGSAIAVSLISLIGIAVLYHVANDGVVRWLVGLSSGTLIGDAFLHLIPEALARDGESHDPGHSHDDDGFGGSVGDKKQFGLAMLIVVGFFVFHLFEACIHELIDLMDRKKTSPETTTELKPSADATTKYEEPAVEQQQHHHHSHQHNRHEAGLPHSHKELRSLSFTILFLDAFHNFLDGFGLAGAFAISNSVGGATLAAIILHEIPQELGDFAIILRGGFPAWKALGFNLLSGLTCILGAVIGLGIIEEIESASVWIIAFTAGGFIYLGGVVLTPAVTNSITFQHRMVLLSGFVIGWVAMILLLLAE